MGSATPREVLLSRIRHRGKVHADPHHLALVLEGGGMRGVVSVGMAAAFEDAGATSLFDSIHGSSAGACGAAYFAAGQATFGGSIYYEDINNKSFIDPARALICKPIMDRSFLIDHVMTSVKPLNVPAIQGAGKLHIVATDATNGSGRVFSDFQKDGRLLECLHGSICLPLIAGKWAMIDGRPYVDGGLVQQIAIDSAVAAGATHIIVLMTRTVDELERPQRGGLQLDALVLRRIYGQALTRAYEQRNANINASIREIYDGSIPGAEGPVYVDAVVRPKSGVNIGRLSIDGELLKAGFFEAKDTASSYISRGLHEI